MSSENAPIVKLLLALAELADLQGETYRAKAYTTAAKSISAHPRLTLKTDLLAIRGIGESIALKITEYLRTGDIAEIGKLERSPMIKTIRLLTQIPGIGPVTARDLYKMGIRKPADLRRRKIALNHMQTVGLRYLDDITQRIPRDTVTEISYIIADELRAVDPSLQIETLGSYRRQLETSGDVDMMCTARIYDKSLLQTFHNRIVKHARYVDTFSHGVQRISLLFRDLAGIARQVDIFHARWEEHTAYLMYATGSGPHNEMVRGIAKAKGYRLNQSGLFKVVGSELQRVSVESEADIYRILGLKYQPPHKR